MELLRIIKSRLKYVLDVTGCEATCRYQTTIVIHCLFLAAKSLMFLRPVVYMWMDPFFKFVIFGQRIPYAIKHFASVTFWLLYLHASDFWQAGQFSPNREMAAAAYSAHVHFYREEGKYAHVIQSKCSIYIFIYKPALCRLVKTAAKQETSCSIIYMYSR